MTQVPYIICYMFPSPSLLKAEKHFFKFIFLMYLIIYLFLNFDFLIISTPGWRWQVWEASEFWRITVLQAGTWGWPEESIILLKVGLDHKYMLALVTHVISLKLQDLHQTCSNYCPRDRQEVSHILGFRDVLPHQLRTNRQSWWRNKTKTHQLISWDMIPCNIFFSYFLKEYNFRKKDKNFWVLLKKKVKSTQLRK